MQQRELFNVNRLRSVVYDRVNTLNGDADRQTLLEHSKHHPVRSSFHVAWSIFNLVVTVGAIGVCIWTAVFAFGASCNNQECKSLIYITNTFLSTSQIGSQSGWAVATARAAFGDVVQYPTDKDAFSFSHYFECMQTAQMADKTCDSTLMLPNYITCLKNNTAANTALTSCNALSASLSQPWPTAEEYLQCLFKYDIMHNSVSVRASQNVFRSCLAKTMWPFFEVQQGIDTPLFLGSFNWIIMLVVGLVCMTSFAVYTASPVEKGMVKYGEPAYHMRLGTMWITVSFAWNLIFLILFFVVALRDGTVFDSDGGLPTTGSTSMVSIFFLGVCVFYFGAELTESNDFDFGVHVYEYVTQRDGKIEKTKHAHVVHGENSNRDDSRDGSSDMDDTGRPLQESRLGLSMPNPAVQKYTISAEDVAKFYTPPLLPAWADGYVADACIFLGMAGATGHLRTEQSWNLFYCVFIYRVLNMLISRYMYQCFMNNLSLSDQVNKEYHKIILNPTRGWAEMLRTEGETASKFKSTPHLSIRVMALSTQLAALFLFAALCFISFDPDSPLSSFPTYQLFFILGFIIPEGLRILMHLSLQVWQPDMSNGVPWDLLNTHFFLWTWDVVIRVIMVAYVILSQASVPGTRRYLMENNLALMDTYPSLLGVL